jgi:hypothetical protein
MEFKIFAQLCGGKEYELFHIFGGEYSDFQLGVEKVYEYWDNINLVADRIIEELEVDFVAITDIVLYADKQIIFKGSEIGGVNEFTERDNFQFKHYGI